MQYTTAHILPSYTTKYLEKQAQVPARASSLMLLQNPQRAHPELHRKKSITKPVLCSSDVKLSNQKNRSAN